MSQLGKLEKPSAESYFNKKKLYCVPNFIPLIDVPEDYTKLLHSYWEDIFDHLNRLEVAGKIRKIFYENVYLEGEEGLNVIRNTNESAYKLIQKKIEEGASFVPIENKEILGTFIDWRNCLGVVSSAEVFKQIYGYYTEAMNKRIAFIRNVIESNLQAGEASLLIMEDDIRAKIQFSSDIEVFLVRPPSCDKLLRWLRDYFEKNSP